MYSLKRVHWDLGLIHFWVGADCLLTLELRGDEEDDDDDGVLEEAMVCMQDSTTLDTATSLVKPLALCARELLNSWTEEKREH